MSVRQNLLSTEIMFCPWGGLLRSGLGCFVSMWWHVGTVGAPTSAAGQTRKFWPGSKAGYSEMSLQWVSWRQAQFVKHRNNVLSLWRFAEKWTQFTELGCFVGMWWHVGTVGAPTSAGQTRKICSRTEKLAWLDRTKSITYSPPQIWGRVSHHHSNKVLPSL